MTAGWPEVTLGEICEFRYGKSLPAEERTESGSPVFGSNGQVGAHKDSLTHGPTVIIGRKGSFGEVHFSGVGCWPIDTTYYVDDSSTKADLRWLYYRMGSLHLTDLNRAAAIPGLNREDAYRQRLLLPPIDEQRRIAAILDKADEVRAKRQVAMEALETLSQAVFIDMFGDPVTNPMGWAKKQLAEIVAPGTSVTYGIVQAGEEVPGGVPYIRTGDIVGGRIAVDQLRRTAPAIASKFERSRVKTNDIVISIRATVGTTAIVTPEVDGANLTQGTARISPGPTTDARYLLEYLRTVACQHWIERQVKGATFREITLTRLRELPVLVPPLETQGSFVTRVGRIVDGQDALRSGSVLMEDLFASLQRRAFQGAL